MSSTLRTRRERPGRGLSIELPIEGTASSKYGMFQDSVVEQTEGEGGWEGMWQGPTRARLSGALQAMGETLATPLCVCKNVAQSSLCFQKISLPFSGGETVWGRGGSTQSPGP